jgi:hypothetical protein
MICQKCSAKIGNTCKFCPACGAKQSHERICSSCGCKNSIESKFCKECGSLLLDAIVDPVDEDTPIPAEGITVEFSFSTSPSFEFAIKEAEKLPGYTKIRNAKKALYRVTVADSEVEKLSLLLDKLKGWRNRHVYFQGKEAEWGSVFAYSWCFDSKRTSYKPELYCFGYGQESEFNLWGCRQARMPFSPYTEWITYGKLTKKTGDWEFDKARIKFELEKNLYDVRFCPALRIDLVQEVLAAFPDTVNPSKDDNWQLVESYDGLSPHSIKGVCPNGMGFIKEIQKKMKLKLPIG